MPRTTKSKATKKSKVPKVLAARVEDFLDIEKPLRSELELDVCIENMLAIKCPNKKRKNSKTSCGNVNFEMDGYVTLPIPGKTTIKDTYQIVKCTKCKSRYIYYGSDLYRLLDDPKKDDLI